MTKDEAMKILRETHNSALFSLRTALETMIPELKCYDDENDKNMMESILTDIKFAMRMHPSASPCLYYDEIDWLKAIVQERKRRRDGVRALKRWDAELDAIADKIEKLKTE